MSRFGRRRRRWATLRTHTRRDALLAAVAILAGLTTSASADVFVHTTEDGKTIQHVTPGSSMVVATEQREGERRSSTHVVDPNEVQGWIVRLRGKPATVAGRSSVAANALQAQHDRVAAEVRRLAGASFAGRASPVRFDYRRVLNGLAVQLPRAAAERLKRHPDVLSVERDGKRGLVLDTSAALVGAPAFRQATGYAGAGQVIAVLDTGVDYAHPTLGGCAAPGAGCRVIGGYDFVNGDADPMDDHGHGTHVAGIAAGDGAQPGIAPEADVLAYKVLSEGGWGFDSWIIAALELATIDGADVINLSLGGRGHADDALSTAVDNATAAGAVVVVAAGNSGGYLSVGSPGAARSAVTVGATDDSDLEAWFTSGGPNVETFEIKPELSAPGVSICAALASLSSWSPTCGAGFTELSGTSMATPHVAGAAALLRGLRSTLTPAEVKSLLVNASAPLAGALSKVGTGRLDVVASGSTETLIEPATLSFGRSDMETAEWSQHRTLKIRNDGDDARSYDLVPTGTRAGLTLAVQPNAFVLDPGEDIVVDVDLVVDTQTLPVVESSPFVYDGILRVSSEEEELRVAWAFVHAPILRVEFDREPTFVYVHNGTDYAQTEFWPGSRLELLVPPGTYDVVTGFDGILARMIIHENVVVQTGLTVVANSADAENRVAFAVTDEDGLPLVDATDSQLASRQLVHRDSGFSFTSWGGPIPEIYVNDVSDAYVLRIANLYFDTPSAKQYFVSAEATGAFDGDRDLTFGPADLAHVGARLVARPGDDIGWTWNGLCSTSSWFKDCFFSPFLPADHDLYIARRGPVPFTGGTSFSSEDFTTWFDGPEYRGVDGSPGIDVLSPGTFDLSDPLFSVFDGDELAIGAGPALWRKRVVNDGPWLTVENGHGSGAYAFMGPAGEPTRVPDQMVAYRLAPVGDDGDWAYLDQRTWGDLWAGHDVQRFATPAGPWRLETAETPYFIGGMPATTRVSATFDTSETDPNPPWMSRLVLENDSGVRADRFTAGEDVVVHVRVHDESPVDVQLEVLGDVSRSISAHSEGDDAYRTVVPDPCTRPNEGISAVLRLRDTAGNEVLQHFDPLIVCRSGCESDADCNDGSTCTTDACVEGQCESLPLEGEGCCLTSDECSDGDSCTLETCEANECRASDEPLCCSLDSHCDDGDACTIDRCDGDSCTHERQTSEQCESPSPDAGLRFHPIEPCRVIDTRLGPGAERLAASGERVFALVGSCGIPATAGAVSGVVTVIRPTEAGYLTLFPADEPRPLVSAVNFGAGMVRNNNLFLKTSSDGSAGIRAWVPTGETDFVLDVTGYFE